MADDLHACRWPATALMMMETSSPMRFLKPPRTCGQGDVGDFLWAMVEYRDGYSMMDDPYTALDERNDDDRATLIDR